jgi:limonene-1,2-epoxide hydrolase
MAEQAESVIRAFLKSWEIMNADQHAEFFSADGVFDDVPRGVHSGRESIRAAAAEYPPTKCEVLKIFSKDGAVVTERVDHFEYGGARFALRVVGMFEVDAHGKITLQRDYYDMKGMLDALKAAGVNVGAHA